MNTRCFSSLFYKKGFGDKISIAWREGTYPSRKCKPSQGCGPGMPGPYLFTKKERPTRGLTPEYVNS